MADREFVTFLQATARLATAMSITANDRTERSHWAAYKRALDEQLARVIVPPPPVPVEDQVSAVDKRLAAIIAALDLKLDRHIANPDAHQPPAPEP